MKDNKLKVFLIQEGKNEQPVHVFIIKDRETAKLYSQTWLQSEKLYGLYNLIQIMEYDKKGRKETNYFIANIISKKPEQKKAEILEHQRTIMEAIKEKEIQKQLKILFKAREIKND